MFRVLHPAMEDSAIGIHGLGSGVLGKLAPKGFLGFLLGIEDSGCYFGPGFRGLGAYGARSELLSRGGIR
jgi:hypothetical protein